MATKKEQELPKELPPRIHVDAFLQIDTNLSPMERSGFKVTVGKQWMRQEEWQKELTLYLNR